MKISAEAIDELVRQLTSLPEAQAGSPPVNPPLPPTLGGGTPSPMDGEWKASVERRLGELHGDVRALLNRGVIAVVALAGMIAGLYLYTNQKFERVAERLSAIEVQQAKSDATLNGKLDLLVERTSKK